MTVISDRETDRHRESNSEREREAGLTALGSWPSLRSGQRLHGAAVTWGGGGCSSAQSHAAPGLCLQDGSEQTWPPSSWWWPAQWHDGQRQMHPWQWGRPGLTMWVTITLVGSFSLVFFIHSHSPALVTWPLTYSLTHSHSFTHLLTDLLSLIHSLAHWLTFARTLTDSLTNSLTHSLTSSSTWEYLLLTYL